MAMTLHTLINETLKLDCTNENDLKEKEQKIINHSEYSQFR